MLVYKNKARKEKDQSYIEYADEFQSLAVQILEKFYLTNPFECTQAIIREIPQFGNVTWLHLAVMAEAKLFIAQRGVQYVINDIWYFYFNLFESILNIPYLFDLTWLRNKLIDPIQFLLQLNYVNIYLMLNLIFLNVKQNRSMKKGNYYQLEQKIL